MKKHLLIFALFIYITNLKAQLPDFKTGISFSYGFNPNNETINLTYDFFNVGGGTNTTFTIMYLASTDMIIDNNDYVISGNTVPGAVSNAFATLTFTYDFTPGDLPPGIYNLVVYLDYGNNVTESNENNNIVSFGTFNYTSVGINENYNSLTKFSAYPIPAKNELNIALKSHANYELEEYKIFDVGGKLLSAQNFEKSFSGSVIKINLNDLPAGIYYLQLLSNKAIIGSKKIVIEK